MHISRMLNMEYLTLTTPAIHYKRDHVLEQGLLNCFPGTASKQGLFKPVHDLTELALPTLVLLYSYYSVSCCYI